MKILAIDIGGTKCSAAWFEGGAMRERATCPTDREGGPEAVLRAIAGMTRAWSGFERIGIGFGGPVNFLAQTVELSTHAAGWERFPLRERIAGMLGAPAVIDNDANAGALGEWKHGAGRGCASLLYLTVSTGIGGGIVCGGGVHRGADSWAGEIGHVTIRPDGPECLCGARGCLERLCCGLWLERDHGRPAKELLRDAGFVRGYVVDLAQGIKAGLRLINPERVVMGGGIALAGDRLFVPLREELERQMTRWSRARVDLRPAELGQDSVLFGAMELAAIS
ncbi:MAG: ROK family protein [Bryobacteraceae bacterium]|nr:ROK family protein [Bryobacteraceae bacterium]